MTRRLLALTCLLLLLLSSSAWAAVNEPTWSYGENVLYNSSGSSPDEPRWSYGENVLYDEYVAATPSAEEAPKRRTIINIFMSWLDRLTGKAWAKEN